MLTPSNKLGSEGCGFDWGGDTRVVLGGGVGGSDSESEITNEGGVIFFLFTP